MSKTRPISTEPEAFPSLVMRNGLLLRATKPPLNRPVIDRKSGTGPLSASVRLCGIPAPGGCA